MNRLASRDHAYSIILALVVSSPSWGGNPWWLSLAELIVLIGASEGVLYVAGGLTRNTTDDPGYPITVRQTVAVIASIAVCLILGGLFYSMS